jgi:hypothetical protein
MFINPMELKVTTTKVDFIAFFKHNLKSAKPSKMIGHIIPKSTENVGAFIEELEAELRNSKNGMPE